MNHPLHQATSGHSRRAALEAPHAARRACWRRASRSAARSARRTEKKRGAKESARKAEEERTRRDASRSRKKEDEERELKGGGGARARRVGRRRGRRAARGRGSAAAARGGGGRRDGRRRTRSGGEDARLEEKRLELGARRASRRISGTWRRAEEVRREEEQTRRWLSASFALHHRGRGGCARALPRRRSRASSKRAAEARARVGRGVRGDAIERDANARSGRGRRVAEHARRASARANRAARRAARARRSRATTRQGRSLTRDGSRRRTRRTRSMRLGRGAVDRDDDPEGMEVRPLLAGGRATPRRRRRGGQPDRRPRREPAARRTRQARRQARVERRGEARAGRIASGLGTMSTVTPSYFAIALDTPHAVPVAVTRARPSTLGYGIKGRSGSVPRRTTMAEAKEPHCGFRSSTPNLPTELRARKVVAQDRREKKSHASHSLAGRPSPLSARPPFPNAYLGCALRFRDPIASRGWMRVAQASSSTCAAVRRSSSLLLVRQSGAYTVDEVTPRFPKAARVAVVALVALTGVMAVVASAPAGSGRDRPPRIRMRRRPAATGRGRLADGRAVRGRARRAAARRRTARARRVRHAGQGGDQLAPCARRTARRLGALGLRRERLRARRRGRARGRALGDATAASLAGAHLLHGRRHQAGLPGRADGRPRHTLSLVLGVPRRLGRPSCQVSVGDTSTSGYDGRLGRSGCRKDDQRRRLRGGKRRRASASP